MNGRSTKRIAMTLAIALLLGLVAREVAFSSTTSIRYELNQKNAFYWGNRIVHGESRQPGAARWGDLWRSYVATYDANEAKPAPDIYTLDYVPLRLLMAGVWVNYLNIAYGPVSEWRPEFARSFAAFSMVMELLGAIAMFALVACWLKRTELADERGLPRREWNRCQYAAAAAIFVWLNPASIVDSHVWPHGQTWILPFYLFAILLLVAGRPFLAGAIFGIGIMFKGQMLLVAPMLILWQIWDRRFAAAARVAGGMVCGVGAVVWPWLMRGSFAWAHAGFGANGIYSNTLRKGTSLNLPALMEKLCGYDLHDRVLSLSVAGVHLTLELKSMLVMVYAMLLFCCAWGIARQARHGDRRLLASLAAPWALMFFILGQMDERYLVWSACFSAGAIAVGWFALGAHAVLTFAGATTMLEFLLLARTIAAGQPASRAANMLILLNPIAFLLIAAAVAWLFFGSLRCRKRPDAQDGPTCVDPAALWCAAQAQ
jgi:hypothetical protein